MASVASIGSGFDAEVKACAAALQSAQKRTRVAFFLSMAASCIVVLMVLNLWESRRFLNTLSKNYAESSEYLKEYSKHIADNSFYQLPALGIQITCDDVGILGPLALLVFSFYSLIAFKASYCQVKCATKGPFEGSPLIRALLEAEQPLEQPLCRRLYFILRAFLFLPFGACVVVACYVIVAHFLDPLHIDSLPEIAANLSMAKKIDALGWVLALLVFLYNRQTFLLWQETKTQAADCIRRH